MFQLSSFIVVTNQIYSSLEHVNHLSLIIMQGPHSHQSRTLWQAQAGFYLHH
jgi:hypothetical protein